MNNFKYELTTTKSFDRIVNDIEEELKKHKFGVLWQLNFKDKLKEKGIEFAKNFKVLEVCNPEKAAIILEQRIDVGYFLPCKIAIYDEGNKVNIGFVRPTMLIETFDDPKLVETAKEVEDVLVTALNNVI